MAELKIKGRLISKGNVESGTSKAGKSWQKSSFVLETEGQYAKKICFEVFGEDKIKAVESAKVLTEIEVSFNVESREFNGKWYTTASLWRFDLVGKTEPTETTGIQDAVVISENQEDDGLPF